MSNRTIPFVDRFFLENDLEEQLIGLGVGDISDLTFRKQSYNAIVYQGLMGGEPVFVKHYETDNGPRIVERSVEETEIVQRHFEGRQGDVVRIIWSSLEPAIVVMSAAEGAPFADAIASKDADLAFKQAALWLQDYVGTRCEVDKYATRYWLRIRMDTDLSHLSTQDQAMMRDLLSLQRKRARGPIIMKRGSVPSDFAPHNLHWNGQAICGFDVEGFVRQPLARAAVWFAILASKNVTDVEERRFGLPTKCIAPFMEVLDAGVEDDQLWVYLTADLLFYRFVKRYDDALVRATLGDAIRSHIETS